MQREKVTIRAGLSESEIKAFAHLLCEGSRDGHYAEQHSDYSYNLEFLTHVKTHQIIPGYPATGKLLAIEDKNEVVCYSLICKSFLPIADQEILFFSVPKQKRRKGYGSASLNVILTQLKGNKILARCMPKSNFMISILEKNGFAEVNIGPSSNRNFVSNNVVG